MEEEADHRLRSSEVALPLQLNPRTSQRRIGEKLDEAPLMRSGFTEAFKILGRQHDYSGLSLLRHALRTAFTGKLEQFAKTRFRLLQLPLLLHGVSLAF